MNTPATSARWARRRRGPHRAAFTLIELLFVMMIIGVLAAISLGALSAATSQARVERTRAIITKLDQLITAKYESYRTRPVPIRVTPNTDPRLSAQFRLRALRELMRMEMPQHRYDVILVNPNTGMGHDSVTPPLNSNSNLQIADPALWKRYRRKVLALTNNNFSNWTDEHEGAECLYLIISSMRDGEDNALDFFAPSEIQDTDFDGVPEIVDAWGMPINFIRWPYGYSEMPGQDGEWGIANQDDDPDGPGPLVPDGIVDNYVEAGSPNSDDVLPPPTMQTRNAKIAPDPFDPLKVDPRWISDTTFDPFYIRPLIYSAGQDRLYELKRETRDLSNTSLYPNPWAIMNDPYTYDNSIPAVPGAAGTPFDFDGDGTPGYVDNITNHDFSEK
jgi:prepilin-type N-terminal cleavage/methylation domain-containing protein